MAFSLVFLVALALTGAANINAASVKKSNELNDTFGLELPKSRDVRSAISDELLYVFHEFDHLVNAEKAFDIFLEYLYHDLEFGNTYRYLQTREFKDLIKRAGRIVDVIHFCDYLEMAGLDPYILLHDVLSVPFVKPEKYDRSEKITGGGVPGYIADIKALLPMKKIKALFQEKMETSPVFARFVDYFRAPRFQELVNNLFHNREFQEIINNAKKNGVDINAIMDLLATRYGFQFPNRRIPI